MGNMVLYASRLQTAAQVKETSRKVKQLMEAGQVLEANILMLRVAGKHSKF
ncbi:hypothetical protein ACF5W4_11345 [Bacillota bacterium Lsc_1132]